ncbi:MAG: thiol-disulfide isomerase/thioredoxin [Polaribacter sp.]|jgi:thiol-disulfide isomerase/thioredoxin
MKKTLITLLLVINYIAYGQNCEINKDNYGLLNVDVSDIKCIAKSDKKFTLVYTFGLWCEPCIVHLKDVLDLVENFDLKLLVLVIDRNETNYAYSKKYLESKKEGITVMSLKKTYGNREKKRYKKFLLEITPKKFNNIDDMSKYILLDKNGNVLMVTSYKDNLKSEDWKDDKPMLERKIIPLITKE